MKRLFLIANVHSGGKGDALAHIRDTLDDAGIQNDVAVIKDRAKIDKITSKANPRNYDAVAVYGGDGTVLKVAQQIYDKLPLLVLPGGTGNGLARTLDQPLSIKKSLRAFVEGRYELVKLDMAFWDKRPFVFDFHFGLLQRTIQDTDRTAKQRIGFWAYFIEGIKYLRGAPLHEYEFKLDGKTLQTQATLCYISNSGLPKLLGLRLFAPWRSRDGYLDIAFCHTNNLLLLANWYIGKILWGKGSKKTVSTYRAKKIEIIKAPGEASCDDEVVHPKLPIILYAKTQVFTVIAPNQKPLTSDIQNMRQWVVVTFYRVFDHIRRLTLGMSYQRFSQLSDSLFIGGQPGPRGISTLQKWGVTAIVSMRIKTPRVPRSISLLHLPTRDRTAISIADLKKGTDFIASHTKHGGKVYVHCRAGEGRAASMVIAYLLTQGMFLNDALTFIKQHRVFIRPNPHQIARLREFARQIQEKQNTPR